MKTCILFGGSGFIGTYLVERFLQTERFDSIIIGDLKETHIKNSKTRYYYVDVRKPIDIKIDRIDETGSWIFNLAAIHREPGHLPREYYETNIYGAENVIEYAERTGIRNIFFTSSIAPYGEAREQKVESSLLQPVTPYGISKGLAEKIHLIWQAREKDLRRLIICRPGVIYGPRDPGNVLRMIKAIKKGIFFFPGDPNIVKAYGYVFGLLDSVEFTMDKIQDKVVVYNYTEWPLLSLKQMVNAIKKLFGYRKPVFRAPMPLLFLASFFIRISGMFPSLAKELHPIRIKKASFPTNIKPEFLINRGFEFRYGLTKSLEHWLSLSPEDFEF